MIVDFECATCAGAVEPFPPRPTSLRVFADGRVWSIESTPFRMKPLAPPRSERPAKARPIAPAGSEQSASTPPPPRTPVPDTSFYVTARYPCKDNDNGSDRGSCDLTSRGSSCANAVQALEALVAARGDVCKRCTEGTTDNTKHQAGAREWIHLGPCRGFP